MYIATFTLLFRNLKKAFGSYPFFFSILDPFVSTDRFDVTVAIVDIIPHCNSDI